ncbi:MAG: hypothetical protein IJJ99_00635 [Oscillospiraceae bacterium]|nr:hypothetical protein [Oscillospiraceae bacterium]
MNAQNKSTSPAGSDGQSKTVTYKFVTGETSVVEVSDEIAAFLAECDREEHAQEVAERRHTYSLDAILYEGSEYSNGETAETDLLSELEQRRIYEALSCLTEAQKRRLLALASGYTFREIAQSDHVDVRAIFDSIEAARRKIIE